MANLLESQNGSFIFEITMDTHSVDLDSYDLKQLAVLRDDKGVESKPINWDAPAGGHHRKGKLVFADIDTSSKAFGLIIRDVAGIAERVLKWQL